MGSQAGTDDIEEQAVQQRRIGDRVVGALGLGAMPLSVGERPDEARAVRTVHAALDAGVTLIDTADAYCLTADEVRHNERLVAKAVRTWSGRADILVATRGGHTRPPDDSWALDGSLAYLRTAREASLGALGVEAIGPYQLHLVADGRADPGRQPTRVDHRFRRRRGAGALVRGAGPPGRRLAPSSVRPLRLRHRHHQRIGAVR